MLPPGSRKDSGLFVAKHRQRRLTEYSEGAEKSNQHGEYDRRCEAHGQHGWLKSPREVEHSR